MAKEKRELVHGTPEEEEAFRQAQQELEISPLSTAYLQGRTFGILEHQITVDYPGFNIPGDYLVGRTFGEEVSIRKYINLLKRSIDRNWDYSFAAFREVRPKLYRQKHLDELVHQDSTTVFGHIYDDIYILEVKDKTLEKLEKKGGDLKQIEDPAKDITLKTLEDYREFKKSLREIDDREHNNSFTNDLEQWESEQKSPYPVLPRDDAWAWYVDFVNTVLDEVDKALKGEAKKKLIVEKKADDYNRLVGIISGARKTGTTEFIETFVGQTFEEHIYETKRGYLLRVAGKKLGLGTEEKSIDDIFNDSPEQAKKLVEKSLSELEAKYGEVIEAKKTDADATKGLPENEVSKVNALSIYKRDLRILNKARDEKKLLPEKSEERDRQEAMYYINYMRKFRDRTRRLLSNLEEEVSKLTGKKIEQPSCEEWLEYLPMLLSQIRVLYHGISALMGSIGVDEDVFSMSDEKLSELLGLTGSIAEAVRQAGLEINDVAKLAQQIREGQEAKSVMNGVYSATGSNPNTPVEALITRVKESGKKAQAYNESEARNKELEEKSARQVAETEGFKAELERTKGKLNASNASLKKLVLALEKRGWSV